MPETKSKDDVLALLDERGAKRVSVAITDMQGQLRGKSLSRDKFLSGLEKGIPFSGNFAVGDFTDVLYEIPVNEGAMRLGEGAAEVVPETVRAVPWEPEDSNLIFLAQYSDENATWCPRNVYKRMEDKANKMGFRPLHSAELEFSLFNETHESLHEKGFRNLDLVTKDSNFYSILRQSVWTEFWDDFNKLWEAMEIPIEACHWELAAGACEAVMGHEEGVRAADNATLYKTYAKAFAQRRDMLMTFMSRWSEDTAGHSAHVHISLIGKKGEPVFFDKSKEHNISDTMRHFIGGLQHALPELMLMLAPNINSFRRMVPGAWAFAADMCRWGIDNRSTPLRIITAGGPKALHVENRMGGADANPYLVLACTLGAGLWGIENKLEPTDPDEKNMYTAGGEGDPKFALPQHFLEAIDKFRNSQIAKTLFGEEFVRLFSETRMAQELRFRAKVSEHELRHFLELA